MKFTRAMNDNAHEASNKCVCAIKHLVLGAYLWILIIGAAYEFNSFS